MSTVVVIVCLAYVAWTIATLDLGVVQGRIRRIRELAQIGMLPHDEVQRLLARMQRGLFVRMALAVVALIVAFVVGESSVDDVLDVEEPRNTIEPVTAGDLANISALGSNSIATPDANDAPLYIFSEPQTPPAFTPSPNNRSITIGSWPADEVDGGPWFYDRVHLEADDWSCAKDDRRRGRWTCTRGVVP